MRSVRKNDTVEVQTGDDAGKRGRVLRVFPADGRLVVEGIHLVTKHLRKSTQYPLGARVKREAAFALANVLVVCTRCDRGVRVRPEVRQEGKVRVCRRCGEVVPVVRE